MSEPQAGEDSQPPTDQRQVRFVTDGSSAETVLMRFADPEPRYAVSVVAAEVGPPASSTVSGIDVTVVRPQDAIRGLAEWTDSHPDACALAATYVRYRGVELLWSPDRAVLLCDPEQVSALLPALAEFAHYEGELRRLEQEVAAAWSEIEQDNPLAFDVTSADLTRSHEVGRRMQRAFQRRIRFARIEPHLGSPSPDLSAAAQKLGEELREKTGLEVRAEFIDGQLEVFEHIYEMASQRMGEFKAAHKGHIMEWIITVLLAAEALLMLTQTILQRHP